ncbi:MAG: hypothetical protein BWZ08_02799 [candidate division BRC1 bacterium ADurb.BinA292]|nr:MAG: hypothetical protein BWZ08_02799 [candidate division BRC1 bacterium ADurb.BinA292]
MRQQRNRRFIEKPVLDDDALHVQLARQPAGQRGFLDPRVSGYARVDELNRPRVRGYALVQHPFGPCHIAVGGLDAGAERHFIPHHQDAPEFLPLQGLQLLIPQAEFIQFKGRARELAPEPRRQRIDHIRIGIGREHAPQPVMFNGKG